MLCNTVEEGEEKCHMFWPTKEGEPIEYGKHKVTLQSETVHGDFIIRKFLIQNEKVGSIKMYHWCLCMFKLCQASLVSSYTFSR